MAFRPGRAGGDAHGPPGRGPGRCAHGGPNTRPPADPGGGGPDASSVRGAGAEPPLATEPRSRPLGTRRGGHLIERVMARRARAARDVAEVRDRRGRTWTVEVLPIDEDDDLSPWLALRPEERVELVGECVLDGLRTEGKLDVPRLRRVHRVTERPSRAVPDRRRVRGRVPRAATRDEGHRRPRR